METQRIAVDPRSVKESDVAPAVEVLKRGGLVAFPTDTVYGLGADGGNGRAVQRLCEVKGRSHSKPIPVLISNEAMLQPLSSDMPQAGKSLAGSFWPGPLTIVLKARPVVSQHLTAGTGTVGVRMPDSPLALALVRLLGRPLAAPSANISGEDEPSTAEQVLQALGGKIEMVLDGGKVGGRPSTVVDVTVRPPCLVREGALKREEIERVIGPVAGPGRILLVCTGNSCRSAMAEGLLKKMLADAGIGSVCVSSAGVAAPPDMPVAVDAEAIMRELGVDLSGHRSRKLTKGLAEQADLVVVMTRYHMEQVLELLPEAKGRVLLLGDFFRKEPSMSPDIPDPIGKPRPFYRESAWLIRDGLDGLLEKLKSARIGSLGPLAPDKSGGAAKGQVT